MGAGDYAAGDSPAGFDAVLPPSPRTTLAPVSAAFFDPSVRDFPLDANGRVVSVHPVDQAVALALSVDTGAIGSVPELGHDLRRIPRGTPTTLTSYARDAVARALKALVDRGDVTVVEVTASVPFRGGLFVSVSYRNNRLSPPAVRTTSRTV